MIIELWKEQVENDFVKNIKDTYTLNLAISILEDREKLIKNNVKLREEKLRLNNIIKEVREYIQDDIKGNYFKRYDDEVYEMCEELLKILDKESK